MLQETNYSTYTLEKSEKAKFISRTYAHLALAIVIFLVLESIILNSSLAPKLTSLMTGGFSWLIVLGVFMGVSYIAQSWANSTTSKGTQYMGLLLFIVAEAIIFVPLLYIASAYANDSSLIQKAGLVTLFLFTGLTFVAVTTKKDFSFLGSILKIGGFVALGFIVASILFGFSLGLIFAWIMVAFASAAILYSTSAILKSYGTDQYVSASLHLFASVALLFWYIIQIFMLSSSRD